MLRIGIIGLGGAGRAHARRLRRNPEVGQVVGYDLKKTDVPGVESVSSMGELLSRVDAVSICTPDHAHFGDIVAALEAGKHVLVEKPMVASLTEAEQLKPHLDAHPNLVFGVHHQMRYAPPFAKGHELVSAGVLGRLFYLEANYWHDMSTRSTQFDAWRLEHGQSLLFGHASHPLDLLMHLAGSAPTEHTTYLSKNAFQEYKADYTSATVLLKFPGNLIAKTHINTYCVFPQLNDLTILGEKGTYIDGILFKDGEFTQVCDFFGEGRTYAEVNIVDIKLPSRFVSLGLRAYLRTFNKLATILMRRPDFGFRRYPLTVYNHDQACQVMIDNFIDALLGKTTILVGYEEATRVIKLCEETEADGLRRMDRG